MSTIDLGEFLSRLGRSDLLSSTDLLALEAEISPVRDAVQVESLGRRLVRRGQLTGWQLQMLLSGRDAFVLGDYRLLDLLGRGGMGTVFQAEHLRLGTLVAIKVMARRLVKSPRHVARFQQEIQAAAAIDHPNVVRAIDAESAGENHFLVMEYVEGADLGAVAERRGRLDVGEACEYVRQAAMGLSAAHQCGLVHRDLKPSNLMLSWTSNDRPRVQITDMGLARFSGLEETQAGLTKTGQMMGTPDYMSPEQAWDTKAVDIRGDIYSLGCVLFRFLIGAPPFQGENPFQTLMARTTLEAPNLKSLDPEFPDGLDGIVAKMLSRDVNERFQHPAEVVEALSEFAKAPSRFDVEHSAAVPPAASLTLTDAVDQPTQLAGASLEQFLDVLKPSGSVERTPKNLDSPEVVGGRSLHRLVVGAVASLVLAALGGWLMRGTGPEHKVTDPSAGHGISGARKDRSVTDVVRHSEQTVDEETRFSLDSLGKSHPLVHRLGRPGLNFRIRPGGPAGAAVDRQGQLTWTPREDQGPGRYTIGIESRDGPKASWAMVAEVVVRVREVDRPPVLESPGRYDVDEHQELKIQLLASDPDRPANTIEYTLGNDAPTGMVVDRKSGQLTWTPTEKQGPGEFTVTVQATAFDEEVVDPQKQRVSSILVVRVSEVDRAPRLRAIPSLSMRVGQRLRLRVRADELDEPAGAIRFSLQGQVPSGASLDPSTGIFRWAPRESQASKSWRFRIRAASADNADLYDEGVLLLKVRARRVTARGEPTPAAELRRAAMIDVRDVLKPLLVQARSPRDRAKLALDVIEQAVETGDAARAYALFDLAQQLAVRARRTDVALDVIRAWRDRFRIDLVSTTLAAFAALDLKKLDPAARRELGEDAQTALVPAVNAGRLVEARRMIGLAEASAKGDAAEVAQWQAVSRLLKQVASENTAGPSMPLKLTAKGKVALGALDGMLRKLRYRPLFVDASKMSFVRHGGAPEDDLEDLGKDLWMISGGDIRLETPAQAAATGFWDKSVAPRRFRLRARLSTDTTTGALLIGGPTNGMFDGLQLELSAGRYCQLYHRGSGRAVAGPKGAVARGSLGWDRLEMAVRDNHIVIQVNGQAVVDNTVPGTLAGFLGLDARLAPDGQPVARLRLRRVRIRVDD